MDDDREKITEYSSLFTLERKRNNFAQRVEGIINDLADAHSSILKASQISENKVNNLQEIYELDVYSSTMIQKAEELMKAIAELKQNFILNDFKSIGEEAKTEEKKMRDLTKRTDVELSKLKREVNTALEELEQSFYKSYSQQLLKK
eukprot:TRINITY_DN2066_c0_g1_i2.p1 TRINITY_DN2066_c0_g1~~TRINITY_DN2066_c0_g1_i2.p1  ORF type:complete len:159 (+),score=39.15 TRINITY_DN2066_c0_g1_i2:37-477(+)